MNGRRFDNGMLVAFCLTLLVGVPDGVAAQDDAPDTRIITVTSFHVPFASFEEVNEYVDAFVMPPNRADPNVLGFRYATHAWGDAELNAWFITEYESLAAIDASNEWQAQWLDENYPEGTPERDAADEAQATFLGYFDGHQDQILGYSVTHAK